MGGWQTREVDTYTVHSIYMYRVGRAKDGRDQGPGKVKGQRMRKNKKTYLIVKLQHLVLIPFVSQVFTSGRLSSSLRLGENGKKILGPIPMISGVPFLQMGILSYEDLLIVGDSNNK